MKKNFFVLRIFKYRKRFLRKVRFPSLEVFKCQLDTALSNLL